MHSDFFVFARYILAAFAVVAFRASGVTHQTSFPAYIPPLRLIAAMYADMLEGAESAASGLGFAVG